MSANTLNIVPSFTQYKVSLHGDMEVTFNSPLSEDFLISFFSSTNEIFTLTSSLYKFRDFAGNLVSTIVFGGRHGLFIELALDAKTGVLYSTSNNIVATGSDRNPVRTKEIVVVNSFEAMDGGQADVFNIKLSNPVSMQLPSIVNPMLGFTYMVYIQQDETGGRGLTTSSKYKFPGGRSPTLSKLPGMIDLIKVTARSANIFLCEVVVGYTTTPIASVDNVTHDTMASAVAAVKNDGTIWLLRTANLQETLASNQEDKAFAVAGMPSLMPSLITDETLRLSFGKAILNPERGELYLRDFQMSGAADFDYGNGSAVRSNPATRYVQMDNMRLYTNENGILTSTLNAEYLNPKDVYDLVIQDCDFYNNGHSTNHKGRTHNAYIGSTRRIFALRSKFTNSEWGHDFKSRAAQNLIDRCILSGAKRGRALDIPNGGIVHASNSYFRKGPDAEQSNLIGIGQEGITDREQQYVFRNCLFENLKSNNYQLSIINQEKSDVKVYFVDCVFLGNPEVVFNVSPVEYIYTGGHLGPEDYTGGPGFIPKVASQTTTANYTAAAEQPVPIYGPDPTLEWFPPTNSPSVNPAKPAPAPVLVRTSSINNYPGTSAGAGGGIKPPPPPDLIPPAISVTTTESMVTKRGPIIVNAQARDNVAVKKVEFFKDQVLINTVTTEPYSVVDYLTSEDNGKVTYTAKAYDTSDNSTTSSGVEVGVEITETAPAPLHEFFMDTETAAEYRNAVNAAPVGTKRAKGAQAIIDALGENYRLYVYSGDDLVLPAQYSGKLLLDETATDVNIRAAVQVVVNNISQIRLAVPENGMILKSGVLTVNMWRFELLGGLNYTRKIVGSVGDPASGAMLVLGDNPVQGDGVNINFAMKMPTSLDVVV